MTEHKAVEEEKFRTFVKLLKRIAGLDYGDYSVHSERATMGKQEEQRSTYKDGYVPAMRTSTPSTDREYTRQILQCSESQLDQFMNNKELKRILLKWGKKINNGHKSTRPDTPRCPIFSKYNDIVIETPRIRLASAYIGKRADIKTSWYKVSPARKYLSLINSDSVGDTYDTAMGIRESESYKYSQLHLGNERLTDEEPDFEKTIELEIENQLSDRALSVSSITKVETADADNICTQTDIQSIETEFEVKRHVPKQSTFGKLRRVSFSNDIMIDHEKLPDVSAMDDNLEECNDVNIKAQLSHAHTSSQDDVKSKGHSGDNANVNEMNHRGQRENRLTGTDLRKNLRSYQLQEAQPRMYTTTSQTSLARRNTLETSYQTKLRSDKNHFLSNRVISAQSRYGCLKARDVIRNENIKIQNRLEKALPVIDTWNRIRPKPANQMGDVQSCVLDQCKYGSLVHFQQVRQANAKTQLRLNNARSKVCSWQSGQIMSLLTAGQARKIKAKRKLY